MYILNELVKIKNDHQRLSEEMSQIKEQHWSPFSTSEQHPQAFILFDLTKKPASVLTADGTFCQMLGYEMEEVVGAPWQKFVHPDYCDRALNIFSSTALNTSIQMDQVYRHKNGAIVFATDVHNFLLGTNRQPVSDFVCVRLHSRLPSPNMFLDKGVVYPALTYSDQQPNGSDQTPLESINVNSPNSFFSPGLEDFYKSLSRTDNYFPDESDRSPPAPGAPPPSTYLSTPSVYSPMGDSSSSTASSPSSVPSSGLEEYLPPHAYGDVTYVPPIPSAPPLSCTPHEPSTTTTTTSLERTPNFGMFDEALLELNPSMEQFSTLFGETPFSFSGLPPL
eukprot:TRINITY_DN986_c0_g1_i4.p1 TRINITY_DN986_c0_g1~~TRINITY_DN986_c0_g1_i4.p1  ORF type:complete len:335 (-),score=67.08 TRINITY_DN986_c0_g1_i4:107-1111(-)